MSNKIIKSVELWDSLLFTISNIHQYLIYLLKYWTIKKHLKKNTVLINKHKNEKCFIVLNGPSLLDNDLSILKDEQVLCVNHFWNSHLYDIVKPNYYLASDSHFFDKSNLNEDNNYIQKILDITKKDNATCIFKDNYLDIIGRNELPSNVHVTYSKHKSTKHSVKSNLVGMSSVFSTVALYAINVAIAMGFSKIYLLGYELPPWKGGLMPHAQKNTKYQLKVESELVGNEDMMSQAGLHWTYYQAQIENYYLSFHAKRLGVEIYNCNKKSFVRAFKFVNYKEIF